MVKQEKNIKLEGVVTEALPNAMFRVKITDGRIILCHLAGKLRMYRIKVMPGDKVKIQMTPYDQTKGRIIYRIG
ncbi:MAG: translation initiation factor IF-1 [Microgenomates group bacterium]